MKTTRPITPNKGVEAAYKKRLKRLMSEMMDSTLYWLKAAYNKNPPLVAQDALTPSEKTQQTLKELADRWQKTFDDMAPIVAQAYVRDMFKATDSAFMQALKSAGWTINRFNITPAVRDALNASVIENVGLIKSIPAVYFKNVQGIVMRSYTAGKDLHTMTNEIKKLNADRAVIIARDQSSKLNATLVRARQLELGFKEAVWVHSTAGKNPRPDHVTASGKVYDISKGCLISGEYIFPGEKINCRCACRTIIPERVP